MLFSVGGLFAVYEGVHKLLHPEQLESPVWALGVLLVAIALEGFSLRTAIKETDAVRRRGRATGSSSGTRGPPSCPWSCWRTPRPLLGLVLALLGVGLATLTGNAVFDGHRHDRIGLLLIVVAVILAIETKSLLLGEAARAGGAAADRRRARGRRRRACR